MNTAVDAVARAYVAAGLALVPIAAGFKHPNKRDWQFESNALHTVSDIERIKPEGIGLAHRWCGTCAIDIDDLEGARAILAGAGIDLDALLANPANAVSKSPRGRVKLWFWLPIGEEPPVTVKWAEPRDGKQVTLLELRCAATGGATVQDVLPPTAYPAFNGASGPAGKYEWVHGDLLTMQMIPRELMALWRAKLAHNEPEAIHARPYEAKGHNGETHRPRPDEGTDDEKTSTPELIWSALAAMPNDYIRDDWVKIGIALKRASQAWPGQGEDMWIRFSTQYPGCTEAEARERWRGFKPTSAGAGTIFWYAEQRGWQRPRTPPPKYRIFGDYGPGAAKVETEFATKAEPPRDLIISRQQFIGAFQPPAYVVDEIIQRGFLYALTAKTGHGKTAVCLAIMHAIAEHRSIGTIETEGGRVLYLAGENPDDLRARMIVLEDAYNFRPQNENINFIAGVIDLDAEFERVADQAKTIGNYVLVIIDTAAAYFKGEDENSNAELGNYARSLRRFTTLPGNPAVVVASHPTKAAARDNLIPRGGGAFIAEIDGNLTLWTEDNVTTTMHWQGKIRGPEFEPISFRLEPKTSDRVKTAKGKLMTAVAAFPMAEAETMTANRATLNAQNVVLGALHIRNRMSVAEVANAVGWVSALGMPQKSKTFRVLEQLILDGLAKRSRAGGFLLTDKGKKERENDTSGVDF